MTLRELRKRFIEMSGRYDLWNDDGSNNGADFFIHRGQRHLENLLSNGRQDAEHHVMLSGTSQFCLPDVRVVKDVYVKGVEQKRTKLTRISLEQARAYLVEEPAGALAPEFYCVVNSRGAYGEPVADDGSCFVSIIQETATHLTYNQVGIFLFPRISAGNVINVTVETTTREPLLLLDDDFNFWTTEWPEALLYASMRTMEISYRNSQGVKDWDAAISSILVPFDMDWVEDDMQNATRMEG